MMKSAFLEGSILTQIIDIYCPYEGGMPNKCRSISPVTIAGEEITSIVIMTTNNILIIRVYAVGYRIPFTLRFFYMLGRRDPE